MNIAFISANKGLPWGGSEELWAAAARRAIEAGHRVHIAVFDWPEPARPVLALRDAGAVLVPIPLRSRPFDFFRHAWIGNLGSPDIVCVSQGQEFDLVGRRWGAALMEWLTRARNPTPCVSVVQYNDDHARPSRRGAVHARAFLRMTEANLYVARRNIEQTERALGMAVPNAAVVRNPVNLDDTSVLPWPSGGPARFACVGRLHTATKGQDVLFAALARPAWRERDWSLSLYGVGPDEACLRQLAEQMRLGDRITFHGQTRDLRGVWASHEVLVMASRGEGTPLAMVEAMLLGRPCVVTDVGDCAAWIREGREGWVAPKPSADDLDATLERAWSARREWAVCGASAAARARELFDPDAGGTLLRMLIERARRM